MLHGKLPELSYSPITTDFVSAATITKKNVAVFAPANHIARSEKCVLPRPFLSSAKIKAATQKSTTALVKHYRKQIPVVIYAITETKQMSTYKRFNCSWVVITNLTQDVTC